MTAVYIILTIIGVLAIGIFAWLYFLSIPKPMSLTDMIARVRSLRINYASFSELERESLTGKMVLKSIKYLENEIIKAQVNA